MRTFLDAHGYVEVETPMLTPIASGAAARPFKTHHNALDIDLYARIAPELYLKRLLVGGFERVYELNRNFRNEGIGYRWNPEFTMLEFYCAYMDVNGMMDFCEELLRQSVIKATGEPRVRFGDENFDFGRPFRRLSMKDAIVDVLSDQLAGKAFIQLTGFNRNWLDDEELTYSFEGFILKKALRGDIDEAKTSEKEIKEFVHQIWSEVQENKNDPNTYHFRAGQAEMATSIEVIFGAEVEKHLVEPTFITDYPKSISPLSKASPDDPTVAERFELFAAGMEIANGFSELNDPVEQFERFKDQQAQRERGDDEAMQMDTDYVRALAYGMPPAAGIGIGIDRLVMLLTNRRSIRDVILFPHMRPTAQKPEEASGGDEAAE
jgi:lysyl-tRNA synthetase class 2